MEELEYYHLTPWSLEYELRSNNDVLVKLKYPKLFGTSAFVETKKGKYRIERQGILRPVVKIFDEINPSLELATVNLGFLATSKFSTMNLNGNEYRWRRKWFEYVLLDSSDKELLKFVYRKPV